MNWKERYSKNKEAGLGTDLVHMVTQMPHNMDRVIQHIVQHKGLNQGVDPNQAVDSQQYMDDLAQNNALTKHQMDAGLDAAAGYGAVGYGLKKLKDFVTKMPEGKHVRK